MDLKTFTSTIDELTETYGWTERDLYDFTFMFQALYKAKRVVDTNGELKLGGKVNYVVNEDE